MQERDRRALIRQTGAGTAGRQLGRVFRLVEMRDPGRSVIKARQSSNAAVEVGTRRGLAPVSDDLAHAEPRIPD
jgi:hypothetical protein